MLELEFAQVSDTGPVRPHNEDYIGFVRPENPEQARSHGWFFALADGVGGHAQGEVASKTAIESLVDGFRKAVGSEPLSGLLQRLVREANTRVFETALEAGRDGAGMATTIVACALRHDRAVIAHVGDSRCYLIRNGEGRIITRDHTMVNEQARMGLRSRDEAAEAANRHILSRSLGTELIVSVDIDNQQVLPGDMLLLCSDGLHGPVKMPQIVDTVRETPELESAVRKLVDLANTQDGGDNVSAQLIRVRNVERVGMYRGRPYKLR